MALWDGRRPTAPGLDSCSCCSSATLLASAAPHCLAPAALPSGNLDQLTAAQAAAYFQPAWQLASGGGAARSPRPSAPHASSSYATLQLAVQETLQDTVGLGWFGAGGVEEGASLWWLHTGQCTRGNAAAS